MVNPISDRGTDGMFLPCDPYAALIVLLFGMVTVTTSPLCTITDWVKDPSVLLIVTVALGNSVEKRKRTLFNSGKSRVNFRIGGT